MPSDSAAALSQKSPAITWKPCWSTAIVAMPPVADIASAPTSRSRGWFLSSVSSRIAETLPPKASGSPSEAIADPVGSSSVSGATSS
jgi:hypothetical protein